MDSVEIQICDFLKSLPPQSISGGWEWERGKWTKAIKEGLRDIGHRLKYKIGANGIEGCDDKEWLFDLTWWETEDPLIKSLPLILESEWSPDPVMDPDFQKLIIGKATHKVWIFTNKTPEDIESDFERYIKQIEIFKGTSIEDRFLLAGLCWNPREFIIKFYMHQE